MIGYQPRRSARRGFTLIELLIVMAIIGVLMGLLMSGVMAALQARDRTKTKFEIQKLDESLKTAMQTYGQTKTLPGKLVLYNNIAVYRDPTGNGVPPAQVPDVNRTKDVLRKMFGSRFITNGGAVTWGPGTGPFTLEGQQCLVFYLGGMPEVAGTLVKMNGFSVDPLNPTRVGGDRIGPFYEFPADRLAGGFGATAGFFNFLDPYKTPYAYFGGTGAANSYTPTAPNQAGFCPSLGAIAYIEEVDPTSTPPNLPKRFANPGSFQILSAGKDKVFAPGNLWDPRSGNPHPNARDDVSNFSGSALAYPQSN